MRISFKHQEAEKMNDKIGCYLHYFARIIAMCYHCLHIESNVAIIHILTCNLNPFASGNFAEKCLLKRVKPLLNHCLAKKNQNCLLQ